MLPILVRQRLEELQVKMGAESLAEVIRRSVALLDEVVTVQLQGGRVVIHSEEGEPERLTRVF